MLLIQMTGLSGEGKSYIGNIAGESLTGLGYKVELPDGDDCGGIFAVIWVSQSRPPGEYPQTWHCRPCTGEARRDSILAAINPREEARKGLKNKSTLTKTVQANIYLYRSVL